METMNSTVRADVAAYLQQHESKGLLRFITCGSVDDGKSTLIGRLLHDTKLLLDDQLAALEADSKRHGTQNGEIETGRARGRHRVCPYVEITEVAGALNKKNKQNE